jgi:hypothetical protein
MPASGAPSALPPARAPFKSVKQLGGSPFFAQNGLLFLSTEQLTGITKSLTRSARLLRELVTDPSLRGVAGMPGSWRTADGRIRVEMTPSGDPDDNENIRTFARAVLRRPGRCLASVPAPSALADPTCGGSPRSVRPAWAVCSRSWTMSSSRSCDRSQRESPYQRDTAIAPNDFCNMG